MNDRFDCIIVGAGPSGITAAYKLASSGLNVVVFERGGYPGAKNMFGGILYSTVLGRLIPEFWNVAPVERHVTKRRYSILSEDSEVSIGLKFNAFDTPPYNNSFTVLRARFDRWFAKKAEEAGALVITETVVDDLIMEDGRVRGVRVGREGGEVYGDVVICAEGANSLLSEKAGLKRKPEPAEMVLGVKEVISLPRGVIEDRFCLEGGQGAALEFFGEATGGVTGSGFIYTNNDTLSVGIGCPVSVLKDKRLKPNELIEGFKSHPCVKDFLRGGTIEEFSAHMIPEGGYNALPKLTTDGLILVGDCAGLVNPSLYREGSNMAMASGLLAAETVLDARDKPAFTKASLSGYMEKLEKSFVLKDLKRYRDVPHILHSTPALFKEYPDAVLTLLEGHFTVSEESKGDIHEDIKRAFKSKVSIWKFLIDAYRARRLWT
ncbi:MAG: FAD-dependent oxidoreductase [Thermodesulfobacteriota bacterium]|nr:MAG: FAD-dependent oxidoreductase [Thermodesulfobacteriota bacterium]